MVSQTQVKCTRCGTVFSRYNHQRKGRKPHPHRHHEHHKGGIPLSPMDNCYYCNGEVKVY